MIILQQSVSPEQVQKLLTTGKTDLLEGFVSAKTRRKFKAYLVKTPQGKIGFEFEARAPKVGAKAGTKAGAKGATKAASKATPKETTQTEDSKARTKTVRKKAA